MAKKQTKTVTVDATATPPQTPPAASIGERAKAAAAERTRVSQNDTFCFIRKNEKPMAPQAETIIATIESAGADGIKRPALVEALKDVLKTRQPASRILAYYQKAILESGAVSLTNPERTTTSAEAPAA